MENKHTKEELKQLQSLPLEIKIEKPKQRIREWYEHYNGSVYVSFSGGKDSTVLLDLCRSIYSDDIPAVFSDTGLEFPEIKQHIRRYDNVDIVRPKMGFNKVISTYGYPLIGKELAESIYYARRIKNGSLSLNEKQQNNTHTAKDRTQRSSDHERESQSKSTEQRRDRTEWRSYEPGKRRRWILSGFRNSAGVVEPKSQFNKERYLPLCRDVPVFISHYCCTIMKKQPMKAYQKEHHRYPIIGTLAEESIVRRQGWIKIGCNAFDSKNPHSTPLAFWTEQDILLYIVQNQIEIPSVYGDIVEVKKRSGKNRMVQPCLECTGCSRTGCWACAFGLHNEKGETRFQKLAKTHPRLYEYAISGGQWVRNPLYDRTAPKMDGDWQNWNPKKVWVPSKKGLGMGKVFDMVNEIYGKNFYRYE